MCCGSRVLGSGGRIAGNLRQNAGPAGAEGLPREAEWRATGSRMAGNWEQNCWQPGAEGWFWKEKSAQLWGLRAFTICFAAWANLLAGRRAGRGRGRLVELVLDEELDGLVFCHSEFVVEDCGVVVSLLCAEPEFSLV